MRILLLNPPFKPFFSRTSRSPAVSKARTLYYPFWLCYCAGVLEKEGHDVMVIDAVAKDMSVAQVCSGLKDIRPDIAVIDTSTPSIFNDIEVLEAIKQTLPDTFAVLVGTHVSAIPEWTLMQSEMIDAVAIGEYDYTIRDLAKRMSADQDILDLKGLCLRRGRSSPVNNGPNDLIEDLDAIPFVASVYKGHLNSRDYYFAAADYPMMMIITGRGCPFRCFFCVYPQTFHSRKYRLRSARNVVDEFLYIRENFPSVREIGIEDDTFTADRKRTVEICDLLVREKNGIKWYCNVRADLDLETMKLMKSAGCRLLTVGFESGSDAILRNMHKGITVEMIRRFTDNADRAGLLVHGCMMVGNPGETRESMAETMKLAEELHCDSFQFYPLFVYPGTEAYEWAKTNGYLTTENFGSWINEEGGHNCVISLPGLSSEDMVKFCNEAFRRYHLNPGYLGRKMRQLIRQPKEGIRSFRSGINYLASMTR